MSKKRQKICVIVEQEYNDFVVNLDQRPWDDAVSSLELDHLRGCDPEFDDFLDKLPKNPRKLSIDDVDKIVEKGFKALKRCGMDPIHESDL